MNADFKKDKIDEATDLTDYTDLFGEQLPSS
jgi:hypothetical protein